jgi:S1-C subfamily serine protease
MSFSAVSALLVLLAPVQQAPKREHAVWMGVQRSVLFVQNGQETKGVGVLIDDSGLFLVHASALSGKVTKGRYDDGTVVDLMTVNVDENTQLAVVRALYWEPDTRRVLKVAHEPTKKNVELLAVTTAGPKTGEFVEDGKAGVMKPSLRYVPLSEMRLESSEQQLGGAIVFDAEGDIVGVLGATLATNAEAADAQSGRNALGGGGGFGGATALTNRQFGPQGVVVAYALGREVLQRVVKGFVSPSHEVEHPTIGVFWKTNPEGKGALVEVVMSGSPAANAGIKPGDVITEIDGVAVNTAVDLAVSLFKKNVGDTITVKFSRANVRSEAQIKVAKSQAELSR